MSGSPPPTQTDRVTLLSDSTRRQICSILTDPDPPVSERDLAIELATRCHDASAADITPSQRRQQLIELHHHQLPKLADYGLICYNRPTRTVSITAAGCEAVETVTSRPQEPTTTVPGVSNEA